MAGNRAINGRDLARMYSEHNKQQGGRAKFRRHLLESLEAKHLRPSDFSLRELFEAIIPDGRQVADSFGRKSGGYDTELLEAGGDAMAVAYADFSSITGQIVFTEVKEKYDDEEFVFKASIESKQSSIQDIEKIPGITRLGDRFLDIAEGADYPRIGVGEDYLEVAAKKKKGAIVEVTKEAVFGDKTGQLLDRCGELGHFMGLNVEKRVIDALIDENAGAASAHAGGHRYTWRGSAYATYQATTPWVNLKGSNALTDWTSLQAAWKQIRAITDPFTGEPIMVLPDTIIVSPDVYWEALRIVHATEVRSTAPGFSTSGTPQQTSTANPVTMVMKTLNVLSSALLKARMGTDTSWYLGKPRKAVRRYYNWDLQTAQRGTGTEAEFNRDIVSQYKVELKDALSVIEPRVMQKNTVAA